MKHFLDGFMIENLQLDRVPEEEDLKEIRRTRREARQMWVVFVIVCVGAGVLVCHFVSRFATGEMGWSLLLTAMLSIASLISAGVCLILYDVAIWLWANRKAGLTVIYPSTMSPALMDFFDNPGKILLARRAVTALISVGMIFALLPAICSAIH